MSKRVLTRLERAKAYLAIAEAGDAKREAYKRAADEVAAEKDETNATTADLARLLGRKDDFVRKLLRWRETGFAASTPFLMDEQATTRAADSHTRRAVRERPDVIVNAINELPAEKQAELVAKIVEATPEAVGKGIAAASANTRAQVGGTTYRELRYPGMSDAEVADAQAREDSNRDRTRAAFRPLTSAIAQFGITLLADELERYVGRLRDAVEAGAQIDAERFRKAFEDGLEVVEVYEAKVGMDAGLSAILEEGS